jgi:hypothetical protein
MPARRHSMRIPGGFLPSATDDEWDVLAIAAGGNQTLSSDA